MSEGNNKLWYAQGILAVLVILLDMAIAVVIYHAFSAGDGYVVLIGLLKHQWIGYLVLLFVAIGSFFIGVHP